MAFKFLILAAVLAYARAGLIGAPAVATYAAAPAFSTSYIHQVPVAATYAAAPVAVHAPSIGASHQSVERSLGGAQSVSHYSKAVDSAFSSVRKYDTRITNDALRFAAAPLAVAHAAPLAVAHASPFSVAPGPVVTKAAIAYSPAAVVSHATFTGLGASYQW